jgi:DNA-binding MarR family transcriptional regulator
MNITQANFPLTILQEAKEKVEQQLLLQLMNRIEMNPQVSQRSLASELGIALGLMNTYLKRCVKKGWVRVNEVPAKRLVYYLTPEGFKEKSHMVAHSLTNSLTFFRKARAQCMAAYQYCEMNTWNKVALVGEGDLAEIASHVAMGTSLKVEVVSLTSSMTNYDAVLITDIQDPQRTYDYLKEKIEHRRLLILDLLHISCSPTHKNNENSL